MTVITLIKIKWPSGSGPVLQGEREESLVSHHSARQVVLQQKPYAWNPPTEEAALKETQFLDLSNITDIYFTAGSNASKRYILIFSCHSSS